jgi:uncharacterized Tic20 family protein
VNDLSQGKLFDMPTLNVASVFPTVQFCIALFLLKTGVKNTEVVSFSMAFNENLLVLLIYMIKCNIVSAIKSGDGQTFSSPIVFQKHEFLLRVVGLGASNWLL